MCSEFSPHVVRLLEERDETMRRCVLAKVKPFVHTVMGSREGHAVFLELLRACEGRFDELEGIVQAACNRKGFLMRVVQQNPGYVRRSTPPSILHKLVRNLKLSPSF
jgi:pumilio RNA-binding family